MKRAAVALLLVLSAGSLQAQNARARRNAAETPRTPATDTAWNPEPMPGGAVRDMGQQDPQQAANLRLKIEERFGRMVQNQIGLSDQEMDRVRSAMRANQDRRVALSRREQDIRVAMARQMQPGQAADADSVARMTETLSHLRLERAESDDQLVKDLAFLPPVKRAQLLMMMQRFEQRIAEIRRQSQMGRQGGFRRNRPL
ncbi:MAG TPA: hypothetical protein VGI92_13720 [Gemmatimonadales bacterium]|jgi:hypothetical protein